MNNSLDVCFDAIIDKFLIDCSNQLCMVLDENLFVPTRLSRYTSNRISCRMFRHNSTGEVCLISFTKNTKGIYICSWGKEL